MPTRIEVTTDDLTEALTSFRLSVRAPGGHQAGQGEIDDPEEVARVLHATLSRIAAEREPDACPDDLTATLDQIKGRGYRNGATGALCARLSDAAAVDVPRLLAAVAAVLEGHEPVPVYGPALNPDGSSACGHDLDDDGHLETSAGEWVCQQDPGPPVCARCSDTLLDDGEAEWPCPTYRAITTALAKGEGGTDG